jgi:hypothetical protein
MTRTLIVAVLYEGKDDPYLDAGDDHDPSHQIYCHRIPTLVRGAERLLLRRVDC